MSQRPQNETKRTMSDASHTNPYTGTTFGETAVYSRGEPVTDGGTPKQEEGTIGSVDHTPRRGAPDAGRVYERGGEGTAETNDEE
ncbi:MAG: hypothetical protein V5A38_00135 [Halolamina sp.]